MVKCLVVVAHPDDEMIWMGGVMVRHRDWDWHVLSLCRVGDPDREPRFFRAAEEFDAQASISDLDDSPTLAPLSGDLREIKGRITKMLSEIRNEFDLVFTHGENGEYGHLRHRQVHQAVSEMVESGDLKGGLVFFAYGESKPDISITLSADEYAMKKHIIRDIYGFREDSFEFGAAGTTEAFNSYVPALSVQEVLHCDY